MTVSLRSEMDADERFLRRLVTETVAEQLGARAWPEEMRGQLLALQYAARRQSIHAAFPEGESRIIEVDGEGAGWLFVAEMEQEIRLVDIMIVEAHRHKGIGSTVIRQVIEGAAANGKPVRLTVANMNPGAERLYERLGFCRVGGDEVQHVMEHRQPQLC
jgi:predicted GNAT family acetyltransferase